MSRIAYCPACSAQEHGVKTRIPLEHTCGLETGEINPDIKPLEEPKYYGPNSRYKASEDEAQITIHINEQNHTSKNKR